MSVVPTCCRKEGGRLRGRRTQGAPPATLGSAVFPRWGIDRYAGDATVPRVRLRRPWALLCFPVGESIGTPETLQYPGCASGDPGLCCVSPLGNRSVRRRRCISERRVAKRTLDAPAVNPCALLCVPAEETIGTPAALQITAKGRAAHPGSLSRSAPWKPVAKRTLEACRAAHPGGESRSALWFGDEHEGKGDERDRQNHQTGGPLRMAPHAANHVGRSPH